MRSTDILIVDDEVGIRDLLSEILQDEGYGVALAENAEEARRLRRETRPAMVLLDIWMPDGDGVSLLKEWLLEGLLNMPVVMMSGHASIDTAMEATKIGAMDFLEKPISLQKLLNSVRHAFKYSQMQSNSNLSLEKLGKGKPIKQLNKELQHALLIKGTVMLTGEVGSPFNLVGRYFQGSHTPWVMVERKEQWLDPNQDWARAANNGVLYLGDVVDYDKSMQLAVLNTLQRKDRYRFRVVSACTKTLEEMLESNDYDSRFLGELSEILISIPPLRAHIEDLNHLIDQILDQLIDSKQVQKVRFTPEALDKLASYNWPGNLEQLKHIVKSLALSAEDHLVEIDQVGHILEQYHSHHADHFGGFNFDQPLRDLREDVEKRYFEYHIRLGNYNMSQVSQRVGLERTHLYRKLKQLGIHISKKIPEKE